MNPTGDAAVRSGAVKPLSPVFNGVGVGARLPHLPELIAAPAAVGFLELLADNHLEPGSLAWDGALQLAERYPVALHCVGMSLGSPDPLDHAYLKRVRDLSERLGAQVVSDHCAFTRFHGREYHDLLPLPHTRETLRRLIDRIKQAQDRLGRAMALENGSRYLPQPHDAMPESEFLTALCEHTGCRLILDVNNAYVNQANHGESALPLVSAIPTDLIAYVHVAGHEREHGRLIDTHGDRVAPEVLTLLEILIRRAPELPVCLEWDRNLPTLAIMLDETECIARTLAKVDARHAA